MSSRRQRRDFTRVFASIAVELRPEQGAAVRGTLEDVTPTGMRIRCDGGPPLASDCRIVLHPRDEDGPTIEARGKVVRSDEGHVAFALSEVPFEEFVRLAHADGSDGQGVGLATSRRLARLLGGEITLTSEEGEGSTFTLWLPRDWPDDAES